MEEDKMIGDTSEAMGGAGAFCEPRRRPDRTISHSRRVQLLRHAERIATDVLENTKAHERCLLRRMVENLLPGEE